jgi:hypothetical protein
VNKTLLIITLPLLLLACSKDDPVQPQPTDTDKPTVMFVAPVNDQPISNEPLNVEVTASDNVGVVKVEIFLNTEAAPVAVMTAAPWRTTIDVSALQPGTHTLRAKAWDEAGNFSNFAIVTVVKTIPGAFHFSFRNGAGFTYTTWELDMMNEKLPASQGQVTTVFEQGSGVALGGKTDWWRLIDTNDKGRKDTLIARVDGNGNLEVYGFATQFIRRFINGVIEGGFPIEMPPLPENDWAMLGYFNTAPGIPADPGSEWDITPAAGYDIPVGLFTANVKIRAKFVSRDETVTVNGKTIRLWRIELSNIVTLLGNESIIKVHVWYSDDPSGRIQQWQESTELNLVITTFPLNGDKWEMTSWQ